MANKKFRITQFYCYDLSVNSYERNGVIKHYWTKQFTLLYNWLVKQHWQKEHIVKTT